MRKKDFLLALLSGFFTGLFAVPTLYHVGIHSIPVLLGVVSILPFLWVFGVWFGLFLSHWLPFMKQFGKFAAIGFLSAAIDFGVLNVISIISGVTKGVIVGGVNIPGFTLAVLNGYVWNKKWTFESHDGEPLFHDFLKFLAVTLGGLFINSSIVILATTYVAPQFGFSQEAWLNIAKVFANAFGLIWNFVGYKFVVFR